MGMGVIMDMGRVIVMMRSSFEFRVRSSKKVIGFGGNGKLIKATASK